VRLCCAPGAPGYLIVVQSDWDSDIALTDTQHKVVWVQALVGFQPQCAWKLDCWRVGALRAARGRCGKRSQLRWRELAHRRLEAHALAIAFDRLDNFRGHRAAVVIVIPE
jgi:hypothetical protein